MKRRLFSILVAIMVMTTMIAVPTFAENEESTSDTVVSGPETNGVPEGTNLEEQDNPGTAETAEQWLPSFEKPENASKWEEALLLKDSNTGEIRFEAANYTLTDEDVENIKTGNLDVWHGYKYKKATVEAKDITVEYGSDATELIDELGATAVIDESGNKVAKWSVVDEAGKTTKDLSVTIKKGKQIITTSKTSYTVPYGTAGFKLEAKTNATGATLKYSSSNPDAVKVDEKGQVTVIGTSSKPVTITVKSAETGCL